MHATLARTATLVLLLAIGAPVPRASAQSSADSARAFEAIDAVYSRFARAYRLGEPDSVVALYADDPLYLPARGDIRRGRSALAGQFAFLRSIRDEGGTAHIEFESVARGVSGDLAYDIGYYTLQVEQADGSRSPPSRGKFTTVWTRDARGAWRIRVDSFSPAP